MRNHTFRRGATYWWRRRVPETAFPLLGRRNICLTLRTTDPVAARRRSLLITLLSETWFTAMAKRKVQDRAKRPGGEAGFDIETFLDRARRILDQDDRDALLAERRPEPADGRTDAPAAARDWRDLAPEPDDNPRLDAILNTIKTHPTGRVAPGIRHVAMTAVGTRTETGTLVPFVTIHMASQKLLNWIEGRAFFETKASLENTDTNPNLEPGSTEFQRVSDIRTKMLEDLEKHRGKGWFQLAESTLQDLLQDNGLFADPWSSAWRALAMRVQSGMERAMRHHRDPFGVPAPPDPGPAPVGHPQGTSPSVTKPAPVPAIRYKTTRAPVANGGQGRARIANPGDLLSVALEAYKSSTKLRGKNDKTIRDLDLAVRLFTDTIGDCQATRQTAPLST
jgi:hypothetical protein